MQTHPNLRRKALRLLLITMLNVAVAFTAINTPAFAQGDQRNENGSQIEGSWILTNERINQNGFTFTAVASFASGGVWLAAGSIDPQNSALYGSWKRTGPNRYDSTSFFYVFDPAGNAVAMVKVNQSFKLTGQNQLTGSGVGLACNLQGENCVSVPAVTIRITGRRIVPETL
ncbi:MAG TPA: hypothetical protein VEX68_01840 [Bryobacteraceae bacterium]|nr:hypothetical protein [Bryobacteraceae bacterium]